MKEEIRELRVKIDGLVQLTKELRPIEIDINDYIMSYSDLIEYPNLKFQNKKLTSKELEKATDSLLLAKAWLGKILGELGEETPYKNDGKRKSMKDIEDAADTAKLREIKENTIASILNIKWREDNWNNKNHIEKVDWLRCSIELVIQKVIKLDLKGSRELAIARTNCYTHLCESKIQLGFELGRNRDNK